MSSGTVYDEGRFPVPPKFDFRHLPLRSKKVTVMSFIGEYDIFLGESQFSSIFCYAGLEIPFLDLPRNYIEGYYDCENQTIFLVFNFLEIELLFKGYDKSPHIWENSSKKFNYTVLKILYFLFIVSHFIVVTCIGTNLSPCFIRVFKLLDKMRLLMRHSVDVYTRDLPLPRDWLNNGRASVPRLLFLFKLQPAQAKMIKNWKLVRQLEQNIVTQIFNTFYETGLISNISANQLFMLPGHNFVHVLFDNQHINEKPYRRPSCEDIAQKYFEFILKNINHISNMSTDKIPNLFGSSTFLSTYSNDPDISISPPSPQNFPAPDQPAQHSLSSFLHLHIESMLDQAASKNSSFGQTTIAYELPTCKAWFMACYRIYTSLVSDEQLTTIPTPEVNTDQSDSSSCIIRGEGGGSVVSLSQSWHNALISILCPTLHTSTLSIAQKQTSQKSIVEEEVLPTSNYNNPWSITDPINRLSTVRYRSAISAAESYYKQDLPVHYSCTYHIIKVISAYNVAIGLTRGQSIFRLLEKLTSRLTHLYLAGRVTCSVLSLSGQPCQYELHRVPDDSDTLKNILSVIDDKSKENYTVPEANGNLPSHSHYQPNSSTNKLRGIDLTVKDECLIPSGLSGKWKRYWIECAIKDFTNNNSSQSNQMSSDEKQANSALHLDNPDQHLAVMSHRSDVIMISSCSCGRQQAERSDPFDYKEANWRFYQILSNICCNKLTSIPLAPQILSDPRHTFCLPNENLHSVTLMSPSLHRTNTNKVSAKAISVLTKPIKVVSSPSPSPPTSRVQKSKESDSTDNVNEDIGLSQIEDNDLLLLSADSGHLDSSEVIEGKSADSDKSKNDNYTDSVVDLSRVLRRLVEAERIAALHTRPIVARRISHLLHKLRKLMEPK
ncbi:Protein SMG8 [Schistosoma japonicum]|uniref:Nonsense-mediated mRNA decay factor SMG8 n=1 Tax=Schistosoma japonicum TaxID=6182 RepID=A0A4Z2CTI2_SCHJA|nr:Protein SMG8 [Schistosoma japonicum]